MINALTPRSASFPWGFADDPRRLRRLRRGRRVAGAVARAAIRGPTRRTEDDAPYFAFGLLAFYWPRRRRPDRRLRPPHPADALRLARDARPPAAALRVADGLKASGRVEPDGDAPPAGRLRALGPRLRPRPGAAARSGSPSTAATRWPWRSSAWSSTAGRSSGSGGRPSSTPGSPRSSSPISAPTTSSRTILGLVEGVDRPGAGLRPQAPAAVQGAQRPGVQRGPRRALARVLPAMEGWAAGPALPPDRPAALDRGVRSSRPSSRWPRS